LQPIGSIVGLEATRCTVASQSRLVWHSWNVAAHYQLTPL